MWDHSITIYQPANSNSKKIQRTKKVVKDNGGGQRKESEVK